MLLATQPDFRLVLPPFKRIDVGHAQPPVLNHGTSLTERNEGCNRAGKRSGVLQIYGKRNKYREVPLNATARTALETYLPTLPPGSLFVFPSGKTGTALTVRGLAHCFRSYVVKARLADVSLHDLRHRFGYRMAQAVPLHRLAQIMGHDSLDTTMIYIRGTKQDLQKEVEKIAWA
jgi:integrase/recombinase XerD